MLIRKCDICKREIKNRDYKVVAGLGWDSKEFCVNCGKPVIKFLSQQKLIAQKEVIKLR